MQQQMPNPPDRQQAKSSKAPVVIIVLIIVFVLFFLGPALLLGGGFLVVKMFMKTDANTLDQAIQTTEAPLSTDTEPETTVPPETTEPATEPITESPEKLTIEDAYVQAIMENEVIWVDRPGERGYYDHNYECWFQDIDMDTIPEFLAGPIPTGLGDVIYAYSYENGNFVRKYTLTDLREGETGWAALPYQLYQNPQSNAFVYAYEEYITYVNSEGIITNNSYIIHEMILTSDSYLVPKAALLAENEEGIYTRFTHATEPDISTSVTKEEFLSLYDAYYADLVFCHTTVQPISCTSDTTVTSGYYHNMTEEEKRQALLESYAAWHCEAGSSEAGLLGDIIEEIRNAEETTEPAIGGAYRAYLGALEEETAYVQEGYLADINDDGTEEMILGTVYDGYTEYKMFSYVNGSLRQYYFGGNCVGYRLYKVTGNQGKTYFYMRNDEDTYSMQRYADYVSGTELCISLSYFETEQPMVNWTIDIPGYDSWETIHSGTEAVDAFGAQPNGAHQALLAALPEYNFAIDDSSQYERLTALSYSELYAALTNQSGT